MNSYKKIISLILAVVLSVFSASFLPASAAPVMHADAKRSSRTAKPSKKSLSSTAAIIMDLSTGTVVYRKNIHKKLYPASITKILTTYLACIHSEQDEKVRFSKNACYNIQGDASRLWPYTKPGEILSMNDCLYSMMLQSANEVCVAVAEHISGSSKKFVDLMNSQISSWGLHDTHFNNPNGLHDPKHYTSAYDMARIGYYAMKNPLFRKVTGTKTYSISATNKYHKKRFLTNHHNMLTAYTTGKYEYKYCTGGKTGFTDQALSTLVTFAEKDDTQLVCVVMHGASGTSAGRNIYTDTRELLNYAFEKYTTRTLSDNTSSLEDKLFTNYADYYTDDDSPIKIAGDPVVFVPAHARTRDIKHKITYYDTRSDDNVIGKITYSYNNKTVGSNDIIYDPPVRSVHLTGSSESSGISSKSHKNIFISAVNRVKFWSINFFQSVGAFFKGRLVLIFIILLAVILIILFVMQGREKRRSRGSYRYRKEHVKKSSKSEGSSMHFSGKKRKNIRSSASGTSFASAPESGVSLSFSSGSKRKKRHTEKPEKNHSSETGLSFSRHKRTSSVEGTIKRNFTSSEDKKKRNGHRRRASFSDYTGTQIRTGNPSSSHEPDVSASVRAKKTRKRHKNTYESFGKNMYDYDREFKGKKRKGRRD